MFPEESGAGFADAGAEFGVGELVRAGQKQEIVGLAGGDQGLGQFYGVFEIDVVVGEAVHDEQRAGEIRRVGEDVADFVGLGVLLRRAEIAFGVGGVVVGIVDDGGAGDAGFEHIGAADGGHGGEI